MAELVAELEAPGESLVGRASTTAPELLRHALVGLLISKYRHWAGRRV